MGDLFNLVLVQPLINLLVFAYNYIPDIGVAIIIITVVVRILLAPSFHKSLRNQKQMMALQPKLNALREKHKHNKEEQAKAIMELYKEHKASPFSSCLPLLIQLPLLFALYKVFVIGLGTEGVKKYLYSFVQDPGHIDPSFLNLVDLSHPSIVLGVIAGITQFVQAKMMVPPAGTAQDSTAKAMQFQMLYFLPVLTMLFSLTLPAGLPLYWIVTTLFAIVQQYYIMKNQSAVLA